MLKPVPQPRDPSQAVLLHQFPETARFGLRFFWDRRLEAAESWCQVQSSGSISRARQPFQEVSQIGNKDAAALTAARTSDVGRLGIHFFGSHNYGRVRTSLGLVAGDDIAMAEVAKLGSDDGSF